MYRRKGDDGKGRWLVVTSVAGRAGDLWRIDVTPGTGFVRLTNGRQVSFAQWSPGGMYVDYLDALSSGVGTLHAVNVVTGVDALIATSVADDPAPAWSVDDQGLIYTTGTRIGVVNLQANDQTLFLKLQGVASAFAWSATSPHQVVVALYDVHQRISPVDTHHKSRLHVAKQVPLGPFGRQELPSQL